MAISTNGTVLARLAGALYNTQMSNATYSEVKTLDPAALANTLYARDFASSTDLSVATTLVTNLGLTSVTGLANWVAAQLTAAGSANKGAKIVDLLNGFAQMTADTTYGAAATAFNALVDASLVLSQTTGNAGGTFTAAGAPVAATFALTVGADTWTGGAGNDTINATVATLGALDVVDGGAGADTLNIVDTGAVTSLGGATFSNIETVKIAAGGAVGAIASPAGTAVAASAQQVATVTYTATTAATASVTINGVTYTTSALSADTTGANAATAIAGLINNALGSVASASGGVITITSPIAGTALPTITTSGDGGTGGAVATTTANALQTAGTAQKEVITFNTAYSGTNTAFIATDTYTVAVDGKIYGPVFPGVSGTPTTAAATIASMINNAVGATVATSSGPTVTVTAAAAGVTLPIIAVTAGGSSTHAAVSSISVASPALATVAAAVDAATVTAPAGTTAYTVTASGDANVAGVSTSAIDVAGTNVKASGGNGTKVAASGSVYVSGSTGAVAITETAVNPTAGFYVATSTTTGLNGAWGSTAANKAGTLVTGGTTVTITGKAGTANTTGTAVSTTDSSAVQIGSPANVGVSTANQSTGKETILNSALAPTGNVSVSSASGFTYVDSTNKLSLSSVIYGAGDTKVYMNGGTTASVTGANTVTITDLGTTALKADAASTAAAGTSKLTTATVNGLNGTNAAATITSDALTNLTVVDARGATSLGVTVTNNTVGHALNLTVGNSGTSSLPVTIADAKATSVTVASQASAYQALGTTAITSGSGSYVTLNTPLATSITATNGQKVNFGDLTGSGYAKVASVNASGATGAITATVGAVPDQGLAITGGAGNDEITLKASTSQSTNSTTSANLAVSLGAGNDKLLNGNTTVHTVVGATFDGGDGTDLVSASLLNSGNAAQFKNFEILGLDLTADGTSYDATMLSGATGLQLLANAVSASHVVTYSGVSTSQGLTVAANQSGSGTTALTFSTAVTAGTADSYTVTFAGAGATAAAATPTTIAAGKLSLNGIETINIVSGSASGYTSNTITLADDNARSLVITGAQKATVGFTSGHFGTASSSAADLNGLNSIDASAMTAGLTINTAYAGVSYNASVNGLSVTTGSGSDAITLAQLATVNAGAGDDTIVSSQYGGVFTGGAGANTFDVSNAVGTTVVVTIADLKSKDVIDMAGTMAAAGTLGAKADVSAATSLATALEIANGSTVTSSAAVQLVWFQYAGNTYLYNDLLAATTSYGGTLEANDNIVKITGLVDLTGSAYTTGAVVTIA